jgi:lipopolysaccharide export system protein LptC
MAIEANVVHGAQHFLVRTAEEKARAFASAERHSRLVAVLRKTLPAIAVLVLASYFVSSQLGTSVSIGDLSARIDGIEVADGNLRMVNPKLEGTDKKNGKYVIGADYADQDIRDPKIIKLHAIRADLTAADGGWSRMNAVRGMFDSKTERLVMHERIRVVTSSGIIGELKNASLDAKTQTLRSHRPVWFNLPNGRVTASALTFNSRDSTLTFRGKVRVHIVKTDKTGKAATAAPAIAAPSHGTPSPVVLPSLPAGPGAASEDTNAVPVGVQ